MIRLRVGCHHGRHCAIMTRHLRLLCTSGECDWLAKHLSSARETSRQNTQLSYMQLTFVFIKEVWTSDVISIRYTTWNERYIIVFINTFCVTCRHVTYFKIKWWSKLYIYNVLLKCSFHTKVFVLRPPCTDDCLNWPMDLALCWPN